MAGVLSIFGSPLKGLVNEVGKIIDKVTTTDEERLEAQRKLADLTMSYQVKMAEVEARWVESQRDTIVAEAKGESWLQRNWRPLTMLFFATIIGVVVFSGGYINGRQLDHDFIMRILDIIQLGLGGYVLGRSAEKIVPNVAQIFADKSKKSADE